MANYKAFLLLSVFHASRVDGFSVPPSLRSRAVLVANTQPLFGHSPSSGSSEDWSETTKTTPSSSSVSTRRHWLVQAGAGALSSVLLLGRGRSTAAQAADEQQQPKKNIVVTGCNSGIGFEACKRLAAQGHTIVLACRTLEKAQDAEERIRQETSALGTLLPAECDLANLQSVQSFAKNLPELLGGSSSSQKIDTLCLNAGLARNTAAQDCARTKDGFELTVGTNHFGHFYLNHLLLPSMANNGQIVVTASSVHDPESPGGAQGVPATLGTLRGLENQGRDCEMLDGNAFNADKAYKDSKLCNILFTRELQRRLDKKGATKGITVNSFSPGLIVGTGFFRDQNPIFTKLFDFAATSLLKVGETPEWGGASLAYMTTVTTKGLYYNSPPGTSKYGDAAFGQQFVPSTISKEGQDDAKARHLWDLTAKELGIPA